MPCCGQRADAARGCPAQWCASVRTDGPANLSPEHLQDQCGGTGALVQRHYPLFGRVGHIPHQRDGGGGWYFIYALSQDGLLWYLIAKANMVARRTAIAISAEGQPVTRTELITHGHGRAATTEALVSTVTVVTGIRTWDNYRPPKAEVPRLAWADRPALNAVVLTQWRNQPPTTDGSPRVILTNAAVTAPWPVVDAYADRSWIENGLFRNSKQFWTLTRWFPEKSAAGVQAHLTFVLLMVATATAYRLWDKWQTHSD